MQPAVSSSRPVLQPLGGIAAIADRYDGWLLDLWGVIHDGSHLYPGAHDTVARLRQAGKKIIFVSNAPRRSFKAAKVLAQLGIEPELYDHVITSGEMGWQWLAAGKAPWGKRYYYIGPAKDTDVA